jgi:hypothetical protein
MPLQFQAINIPSANCCVIEGVVQHKEGNLESSTKEWNYQTIINNAMLQYERLSTT